MNKKTKFFIVVIVILSLLVISYGSFMNKIDTIFDDNNIVDNDVIMDDLEQESLLSNDDAKIIVKELEEKYYEYARVRNLEAYCGKTDSNDYISFGSYETNDFRDYWASTQFKSISDLRKYFDELMIEELKPSTIDNGFSYIEQDDKLYCQLSHKGLDGFRDYEKESEYNIISINSDMIVANVSFFAFYMGENGSIKREAMITVIKDYNDRWLVSNYEFKN